MATSPLLNTPESGAVTAELRRARLGDSAVFFLAGAVFANFAARVPAIKQDIGVGDGELAIAFMGLNAGAVLGLQLGGVVVPRVGSRRTLRVAVPVFALALVAPGLAGNLLVLSASLFLLACANSVVDVGMNSQGVVVERGFGRPLMSSLHSLHSVGLVAGAGVGALAAYVEVARSVHFAAVAVVAAGAGVAACALLLESRAELQGEGKEGSQAAGAVSDSVRGWSRPILLLGALAFGCTVAEGAALDWSAVYLRDSLGVDDGVAALGFAVFASAMAVGRLSGDRLVARFGAVRVFRASVLVAGAGLGGALAAHAPAAGFAGLALLGGGLAFALPLSISAGGNLPDHSPGVAAARVSTLGYLGSFTGPALIGVLASALDLRAALVLPAAIVAATALGARSVASAQSGPDRA